jgi:release factor glutamine methyltransferase
MTISKLKNYCYNKLKQASNERPDFESELLLAYVLKKDRTYIISHPETKVSVFNAIKIAYLCQKRTQNTPLAYLLKEKHFYNLKLFINRNVLIPRPESELFIDYFKDLNYNNSLTIDVGTGSGALIISLLKNINLGSFNKKSFLAIDIDKSALKIAKNNAKRYNLLENIDFKQSDLLENISNTILNKYNNIHILANLPYLNETEMQEPSIKKEPKTALYSPDNGLFHYFRLLKEIRAKIDNDTHIKIAMEINPGQKEKLVKVIKSTFLNVQTKIVKDYNDKDRLVIVEIN